MRAAFFYAFVGMGLFSLGLYALIAYTHLLRKILAINVMDSGVFLALVAAFAVALSVAGLGWQVLGNGVYRHAVGGWGAPLGIDLYADGMSLLMLAATALVGFGVSGFGWACFSDRRTRRSRKFSARCVSIRRSCALRFAFS